MTPWTRRKRRRSDGRSENDDDVVLWSMAVNDDADDCGAIDVAFGGGDKSICDYLNYSMCETLCDRDYKRHCSMVADVVVPCDVLMLIWC